MPSATPRVSVITMGSDLSRPSLQNYWGSQAGLKFAESQIAVPYPQLKPNHYPLQTKDDEASLSEIHPPGAPVGCRQSYVDISSFITV